MTDEQAEGGDRPRTVAVAVAVAVVAALLLLLLLLGLWRWRAATRPTLGGARTVGLRADCLGAGGQCTRAAQLRLVLSNGGGFRHVFVVGLDAQAGLHSYAPRSPEVVSAVAPAGVDQPLGAPLGLSDHAAGRLRIYALFSDAPLATPELLAAVAALRQAGRAPATVEKLPLERGDVVQASVVVDLVP